MGTTANYGWPFPDPGTTVDIPRDIKALAQAIDTSLLMPTVRAHRTVDFSVPSANAPTVLPFNTKLEDPLGMMNANGDLVTIKLPGIWMLTVGVGFSAHSTGSRMIEVKINGLAKFNNSTATAFAAWGSAYTLSAMWRYALNDTVVIGVAQNSGVALTLTGAANAYPPFMCMQWLRP